MSRLIDRPVKICHLNVTVTDAENTTPTTGIDLLGYSLAGISFPSTFDGTALTFTVCDTQGGTYLAMIDKNGTTYTVTCAASRYVALPPADFAGIRFIKPVCSTAQSTTDTIFVFHLAPILTEM